MRTPSSRPVFGAPTARRFPERLKGFLGLLAVAAFAHTSPLLAAPLLADEGSAGDAVEDADYRFRLQRPGPGWRVLGEAEAKKLVPDAVAGASMEETVYGVVIVEAAGGVNLADFAALLQRNLSLEEVAATAIEEIDLLGTKALRWRTTGRARGLSVVYQHVVFLHGGFAYQLVTWGLAGRVEADGSSFLPFVEAFWLLEGPVRARAATQVTQDADGVGWRVRDGVFASAAYGIEVRPPEGWRLAVGSELRNMNASAEVGLVSGDPEAYLVLIVERVAGSDREGFLKSIDRKFTEGTGAAPSEERSTVSVDGRPVSLRHFAVDGPPRVWFLQGAFFEGDLCIQVLGWFLAGLEDRALPRLRTATSGVRFLDAREARLLEGEVEAGPDVQNRVGPDWALRRGTYRDFAQAFTWKRPPGWWRVRTGEDARATNALAALHLEEPSLGVFGLVLTEPAGDLTPEAYHRLVLANVFEDPASVGEPEPLDLGAAVAHANSGRRRLQDLTFRYRVASAVHAGRAFQILFWGTPENMKAAARAVEAALEGFRFVANPAPTATNEAGFRDERLGYAMAPLGEGWQFGTATPEELAPIGSMVQWRQPDREEITLGAFCTLDEGQDEAWLMDLLMRQVQGRWKEILPRRKPVREPTTWAGLPAERLRWPGSPAVDLTVVHRDRTLYFLVVEHVGDPVLAPDDVMAKVTLLD